MSTLFWRDQHLAYVIESRRACDSYVCYKPHSYETYSIGVVDAGQSVFSAQSAGQHHLQTGSMMLIPAHQEHACNPSRDQAWSYQMLHLDHLWLQQLHHDIESPDKHPLHEVRLLEDPKLYQAFCRLNELLFSDQPVFIKQVELYQFLQQLFTTESASDVYLHQNIQHSALIETCIQEIDQHGGLLNLDALAEMTKLSHFQIIRQFKAHTGFTPHHFQLNLRINRARHLLLEQHRLSDIAYQLGFADQSHFQRTFKVFVGITPQQYQKASTL